MVLERSFFLSKKGGCDNKYISINYIIIININDKKQKMLVIV